MGKLRRSSRIAAITKILVENPNRIIGLGVFATLLDSAKSTISEDIVIVREGLQKLGRGEIKSISGASGGVKYTPTIQKNKTIEFANKLCEILRDNDRIIAGNYMYMTDVMCNPQIIQKAGIILYSNFANENVEYVITVETKGIPLAYEVAKNLGVQLVIARRQNKVTEGSTVTINYVSGTAGTVQQMSLSKKAMTPNSKCIFIDDFMKGGGTALGIKELLKEFNSELVGIGVMVDNRTIKEKLVEDYVSIVQLNSVDKTSLINIQPSEINR